MRQIRLKFAIQRPDFTLSDSTETTADQITPNWVRFIAPADFLAEMGVDLSATISAENRVVMFIYLDPAHPPIRAIGAIYQYEKIPHTKKESYTVVVEYEEIAEQDRQKIQDYLQEQALDRRAKIRREGDRFFQELGWMLEILVNMSEGKKEEFSQHFTNLVSAKSTLGRRSKDKKLGDGICLNIERLASNLVRTYGARVGLRKVNIRKVTGKEDALVEKEKIFVGWEEAPPQVGRSYCVYLEGGGIFRSAVVREVSEDHFQTLNSLYEIQTALS